MATRKGASKGARKSTKKSGGRSAAAAKPGVIRPLYGVAIDQAIARGDKAEMRRLATAGRKYLKEVQAALKALDRKAGGK